jgi:hypothetical protein
MSGLKIISNMIGDKFWKNKDGELHRTNGPAIEYANGGRSWYINGKRHRLDGQAIDRADGRREWYVNDKYYSKDSLMVQLLKAKIEGRDK